MSAGGHKLWTYSHFFANAPSSVHPGGKPGDLRHPSEDD
jgi:hypothetical protein